MKSKPANARHTGALRQAQVEYRKLQVAQRAEVDAILRRTFAASVRQSVHLDEAERTRALSEAIELVRKGMVAKDLDGWHKDEGHVVQLATYVSPVQGWL